MRVGQIEPVERRAGYRGNRGPRGTTREHLLLLLLLLLLALLPSVRSPVYVYNTHTHKVYAYIIEPVNMATVVLQFFFFIGKKKTGFITRVCNNERVKTSLLKIFKPQEIRPQRE